MPPRKTNENVPAVASAGTPDEFAAALREAGFLSAASGGTEFHRIKMNGSNLMYNDEVIASYNLRTKEPALIVQLTDAPVEYQAMWFEEPLARAVGRPEIANKFCRSHFDDPKEARKYAQDGTPCDTCPVHPFMPINQIPPEAIAQQGASKCSWKGDVEFKILDVEDGKYVSNDDTLYTMTLATTGIIEFKGSSSRKSNPLEGSVSAENFMVQLAKLGLEKWGKEGLMRAHTYLRLGGVIAELHLPMAQSQDGSRSYNVPSFKPIDILEVEERTALPSSNGATAEAPSTNTEDALPF